jgi:glycosyltransferase involved in cell wall biosynthesis
MVTDISVFLPCFNEEAVLAKTVEQTLSVIRKRFKNWELILIDDGSKDKTGRIIDTFAGTDKRIIAVHHPRNRGYGAALKSGFYTAGYPWIAFTDGDGQFDFSEIDTFITSQKQTGADMVIGFYRTRHVPLFRKVNTFAWQTLVFALFGLKVKDIDCAFKLISKKVIDTIPRMESERGAFISSELLIKAKKAGFKIVEVPVTHYPAHREGTGARLNVILKSLADLFRLWLKLL